MLYVATTKETFKEGLSIALRNGGNYDVTDVLANNTWKDRLEKIIAYAR